MLLGLFRWLRTLVCAILVLAGGLALAEVALRLQAIPVPAAPNSGATSAGNRFPLAMPSWQLGWELKPSSAACIPTPSNEEVVFQTNSLGLRGHEVAVPKPAGRYRIVCLGDETLLAPEVSEAETFCQQLRTNLQARSQHPIEVINAGLPHGCPLTEWLLFRTRLLALQPDLVLVHVTWADLADDRDLRRYTACDRDGAPAHLFASATCRTTMCQSRRLAASVSRGRLGLRSALEESRAGHTWPLCALDLVEHRNRGEVDRVPADAGAAAAPVPVVQ